ncbi:DUF378 domain-containing protein [Patescibacteria group bacterium]|nr:DUF378 domain-containing protein [Patescibacteria group bacterium]
MKSLHMVAFVLLVIGGLNWLLVAFGYNLVDKLLGVGSTASMVVYVLVGLSAIYEAATHKANCRNCVSQKM